MRKFSLELPKYRLQLHLKLIRRRKPLVEEPLVPTPSVVNKKYRSGSFLGKTARHISTHKRANRVFATGLAAIIVTSTLIPSSQSTVQAASPASAGSDNAVIQVQNSLSTEHTVQYPLVDAVKINQGFGSFHPGLDLGAEIGDPIKPFMAGTVVEAGYVTDGYGNTILIDHGRGLTSRYAHLSKIEVEVGQKVTTSTEIGKVGISGHTTGPHLHFEIRLSGTAQNPCGYIPCSN